MVTTSFSSQQVRADKDTESGRLGSEFNHSDGEQEGSITDTAFGVSIQLV